MTLELREKALDLISGPYSMYMVFDSMYLACRSRQLLQNISSLDFPCYMIFHKFHDFCRFSGICTILERCPTFEIGFHSNTPAILVQKTVRSLLVFNALFVELPCSPSWMRINNGGNNTTVPRHPVLAMDPLRMQYVITTTIPITNLMQTLRPTIPQLPQLLLQHSLPNPYPHPRHPTTQHLHSLALYPPISPPYQTHGPPATHTLTPIQYMVKHYSGRSSRHNGPENTIWQGSQSWTSFLGSSVALASRTTAFRTLSQGRYTGIVTTRSIAEAVFTSQLLPEMRAHNLDIDSIAEYLHQQADQSIPNKTTEAKQFMQPLISRIIDFLRGLTPPAGEGTALRKLQLQTDRLQQQESELQRARDKLKTHGIGLTPTKPGTHPAPSSASQPQPHLPLTAPAALTTNTILNPTTQTLHDNSPANYAAAGIQKWLKTLPPATQTQVNNIQQILRDERITKKKLQEAATRYGIPLTRVLKLPPRSLQQLVAAGSALAA